jgi:hypothetical protein
MIHAMIVEFISCLFTCARTRDTGLACKSQLNTLGENVMALQRIPDKDLVKSSDCDKPHKCGVFLKSCQKSSQIV